MIPRLIPSVNASVITAADANAEAWCGHILKKGFFTACYAYIWQTIHLIILVLPINFMPIILSHWNSNFTSMFWIPSLWISISTKWSFPVIHKVSNTVISVLLKFENKKDRSSYESYQFKFDVPFQIYSTSNCCGETRGVNVKYDWKHVLKMK